MSPEVRFHSRIDIGQIIDVREDEGLMTVRLVTGAIHKMPIPVIGLSPPVVQRDDDGTTRFIRQGAQSSWMRYMPQVGDFVKVGYGHDNRPEAVANATWGDIPNERGPAGQLGGYARVSAARDRGEPGLETFYTLQQGEWDMRSSGQAYIRGGRYGTLTLAGGAAQVLLKKEQDEIDVRTDLWRQSSRGSELRLGRVKRVPPSGFQEEVVQGAGTEFGVRVAEQSAPAPAPPQEYYTFRAGDLRNAVGLEEFSSAGHAIRVQERVTDAWLREVDTRGNVYETLGSGASRQDLRGGDITEFSRTGYLSLTYQASQEVVLDSARIALGSSSASEPMVLGNQLLNYLYSSLSVLTPLGPSGPVVPGSIPPNVLSSKVFGE